MNVCVLACACTQIHKRTIAQVADSVVQDDGPVVVLKHTLCEHLPTSATANAASRQCVVFLPTLRCTKGL